MIEPSLNAGLVNAGFAPGDYSKRASLIQERTQLTSRLERSTWDMVSLRNTLVCHNTEFYGERVSNEIYQRRRDSATTLPA